MVHLNTEKFYRSAIFFDDALKTSWIAALRSGEYRQHRGSWHGAFNEVCAVTLLILEALTRCRPAFDSGRPTFGSLYTLPLADIACGLLGHGRTNMVMRLNDHYGMTFNKIAEYVEKFIDIQEPFDSQAVLDWIGDAIRNNEALTYEDAINVIIDEVSPTGWTKISVKGGLTAFLDPAKKGPLPLALAA